MIFDEVFENFDARLENLHWRETDDGTLLVGDSEAPTTVVRISIEDGDLSANQVDPDDSEWSRAFEISRPETISTPQYD